MEPVPVEGIFALARPGQGVFSRTSIVSCPGLVLKGFCKFLSYFDFRSLTGVLMQRIEKSRRFAAIFFFNPPLK